MSLNIAMDGPVGAGKSTIADAVAARLGILHLDTGAMYRALGVTALERGMDVQDEDAMTALAREITVSVAYENGAQRTCVDGRDVTGLLRTEQVSMAASTVARHGGVRRQMVAIQQQLAAQTDMLVDGRDICVRVLPKADVKIYLTASPEERAMRRWKDLQAKGSPETYEQVLADLRRRDDQDMNREVDPLHPTPDAVIVDTTGMTFDQVVDHIVRIAEEKRHE